jgi:hypothetical protein
VDPGRKMYKSKDVFGDFLESVSDVNPTPATGEAPATDAPPEPPVPPESRAQESSLGLMQVLAYLREHSDQSLPEVAAGLGSPILQTAEVINKLATSGVLELQGNPGSERIKLTEAGINLSSVS